MRISDWSSDVFSSDLKIFTASALAIASLSISPMLAAPAAAQASSVAVADVRAAAAQSNALKTASQQIQTRYQAQIDQQESRGQTLQAELNVLVRSEAHTPALQ